MGTWSYYQYRYKSHKVNVNTGSRTPLLFCLLVHNKSLHSTQSAPLVKCEDLWVTETKSCNFLSDLLSLLTHPLILSIFSFWSFPLRSTRLSWRRGTGQALSVYVTLCYSSVCVCVHVFLTMCQHALKNRGESTGGIGVEVSDWKTGANGWEEDWSGGRRSPLKVPESSCVCVCVIYCRLSLQGHAKCLTRHFKDLTILSLIQKKCGLSETLEGWHTYTAHTTT